jgi:hypothetical protein
MVQISNLSLFSALQKSRVVRQELRKLTKEFHKKENDARVAAKSKQ